MNSDQTVNPSPGGSKERLFGACSGISATATNSIGGDGVDSSHGPLFPLDPLVIKDIPQEIEDAVAKIVSELSVPEEPDWARNPVKVLRTRYSEPDTRDWKSRAPQALSPAIIRASNPWVPRRGPVKVLRTRSSEPDTRDWKSRAPPQTPTFEDKGRESQPREQVKRSDNDWRDREQDRESGQQGSRQQEQQQYSYRQQDQNPKQEPSAAAEALAPALPRRGPVKVLRTVKGILNKLTPEKFEVLLDQLLNAGIDSADILKRIETVLLDKLLNVGINSAFMLWGIVSLVFDKAVMEPIFCPMFAELCVHLSKALPEFPSDEDDGIPVTFRRLLLNSCQEEFEGADNMRAEIQKLTKPEQELERFEKEKLLKLRTLGNIRLIGELFKQKMISEKIVHECIRKLLTSIDKATPAEENVAALCQLLSIVGKQLDENSKSKQHTDSYFTHLKDLTSGGRLIPRIKFMILNTLDMRANNWVPRREEVKVKTINEIHTEAEQKLGIHPGMTGLTNGRDSLE